MECVSEWRMRVCVSACRRACTDNATINDPEYAGSDSGESEREREVRDNLRV